MKTEMTVQSLRLSRRWIFNSWSSGLWRRAVMWQDTKDSDDHAVSIFSVNHRITTRLHDPEDTDVKDGISFYIWQTKCQEATISSNPGVFRGCGQMSWNTTDEAWRCIWPLLCWDIISISVVVRKSKIFNVINCWLKMSRRINRSFDQCEISNKFTGQETGF